ncbi:unnamed protein product, partial [Brassica oleracea]
MKLKNCQKKENRDCWLKKQVGSRVVSLGRNGFIRKEDIRYGESSKRFTTDGKTANLQDNNWGRDLKETTRTACGSAMTSVMLREM